MKNGLKTVHKYPLQVIDNQMINVTKGAKPLHVEMQNGSPQLWCLVDCETLWDEQCEDIHIQMLGTGHQRSELGDYIGTFPMHDGGIVFHVFHKSQGSFQ